LTLSYTKHRLCLSMCFKQCVTMTFNICMLKECMVGKILHVFFFLNNLYILFKWHLQKDHICIQRQSSLIHKDWLITFVYNDSHHSSTRIGCLTPHIHKIHRCSSALNKMV
jgi:hypothetical protein